MVNPCCVLRTKVVQVVSEKKPNCVKKNCYDICSQELRFDGPLTTFIVRKGSLEVPTRWSEALGIVVWPQNLYFYSSFDLAEAQNCLNESKNSRETGVSIIYSCSLIRYMGHDPKTVSEKSSWLICYNCSKFEKVATVSHTDGNSEHWLSFI